MLTAHTKFLYHVKNTERAREEESLYGVLGHLSPSFCPDTEQEKKHQAAKPTTHTPKGHNMEPISFEPHTTFIDELNRYS